MSRQAKKRVRKNFNLPAELVRWAETYVDRKNTTMTQLIVDYLTDLREIELRK